MKRLLSTILICFACAILYAHPVLAQEASCNEECNPEKCKDGLNCVWVFTYENYLCRNSLCEGDADCVCGNLGIPTPTPIPRSCSSNSDCSWCGSQCVLNGSIRICTDNVPPPGYTCGCSNGTCVGTSTVRASPTPTPTRNPVNTPTPIPNGDDDDDDVPAEDEGCPDAKPPVPSWSRFNAATQMLSWSAMGGDKVQIKFSGDPNNLRYYFKTENDGSERVGTGTVAGWFGGYWKIRTINGCKYSDWSSLQQALTSSSTSSTQESTVPATGSNVILGIFIVSSLAIITGLYLLLIQSNRIALRKFESQLTKDIDKNIEGKENK